MFGLTVKDVRTLAYDVLKANPHLKNHSRKKDVTSWLEMVLFVYENTS
jgi:hypothetical protein